MSETFEVQQEHTAGPQSIGFDYQFYYFMLLSLELAHGDQVGFEVKDDVHIDHQDGRTTLFQLKHTVQTASTGSPVNMTSLDSDLWKTLGNWAEMVNAETKGMSFLNTHYYRLVTNKSDSSNSFIDAIDKFKLDKGLDKILVVLNELKDKTLDPKIKEYIDSILKIKKNKQKIFFSRITIETGLDDIIQKVKNKIHQNVRDERFIDPVFHKLSGNMHAAKYTDIKGRKDFMITFEEFNKRFGKCFKGAWENKSLPKRKVLTLLPEDPETQLFIIQLIDIGIVEKGSPKIRDYTTHMLQALNHFAYWVDDNFVLPDEMEEFHKESKLIWDNQFEESYHEVKKKLSQGIALSELEDEIKSLGANLVYYLRKQDLKIEGNTLGIEFSNGQFYALSDQMQIGWHYDWENKYKKS